MHFGSLLVQSYGEFGALEDAYVSFANLQERNAISWNFLIRAYARHGQGREALVLFQQMQSAGVKPDRVTFVCILSACVSHTDLPEGRCTHKDIVSREIDRNVVAGTALVTMYGKCGSLKDAHSTFDTMTERTVISWNAMIAAYAQNNRARESIQLFFQMEREGIMPDKTTFVSLFNVCASLDEGEWMHGKFLESGIASDFVIGNALVNTYGRFGNLRNAWKTFEGVLKRNVISWTSMIAAHVQKGKCTEALELFGQMQQEGIMPNKLTFISILRFCSSEAAVSMGERMHVYVVGSELEADLLVGNALVDMHSKCGSLEAAWNLFRRMPERDTVSWTAMISANVQHCQGKGAFLLFKQMQHEGVLPDTVTFITVLSACASQAAVVHGKQMHVHLITCGPQSDVSVGNSLLSMYGRCNSFKDAWLMFDEMRCHDTVSWNAMITACAQHGQGRVAMHLFKEMLERGQNPDNVTHINILLGCVSQADLAGGKIMHAQVIGTGLEASSVVGSAIVNLYAKCGCLKEAQNMFDTISERDVILWTNLISIYAHYGQGLRSVQIFRQMQQEGVMPNKLTVVSFLNACDNVAALTECQQVHASIMGCFQTDIVVGNALITVYGRCNSMDSAWRIFDSIPDKDIVSWTAIIAGYAKHGTAKEALQLFNTMLQEGVMPDEVVFITILSACATQADLTKGKRIHGQIVGSGFSLDGVLGNALITMYSKCGDLETAQQIFKILKRRDLFQWNALIAASAHHGLGTETLLLFHQMKNEGVMPNNVTYVSILSACSHAGLVDEGSHYFVSMSEDHSITPVPEHFNCIIDLFVRVGRLAEAEDVYKNMPFQPTLVSVTTLLSQCRH